MTRKWVVSSCLLQEGLPEKGVALPQKGVPQKGVPLPKIYLSSELWSCGVEELWSCFLCMDMELLMSMDPDIPAESTPHCTSCQYCGLPARCSIYRSAYIPRTATLASLLVSQGTRQPPSRSKSPTTMVRGSSPPWTCWTLSRPHRVCCPELCTRGPLPVAIAALLYRRICSCAGRQAGRQAGGGLTQCGRR
jgi:hypothetical protein